MTNSESSTKLLFAKPTILTIKTNDQDLPFLCLIACSEIPAPHFSRPFLLRLFFFFCSSCWLISSDEDESLDAPEDEE
jgi:hypothetical protein